MSVRDIPRPPMGDAPARAAAKESVWRLAGVALGHPVPEFYEALRSGAFHQAFDAGWSAVTGRSWPGATDASGAGAPSFEALEAGYIAAFLHGRKGKPVAPLLAGDYDAILAGRSRPAFMLNIAAFYKHFGLKAAEGDEGRRDEPDHAASMLEFMAVLSHFEARALRAGRPADGYRRAQRDFLRLYLAPLLNGMAERLQRAGPATLDATVRRLVEELPAWAQSQIAELEARVGPYRGADAPPDAAAAGEPRVVTQDLWG